MTALALPLLLAGCTLPPVLKPAVPAPPPPPPMPRVTPVEVDPAAPATRLLPPPVDAPAPSAVVLAYADRIRALGGNDLGNEIARLGDPSDSPQTQMQLAIALAQTRNPPDLVRAISLMQRVIGNPSPEAQPLQPLARALVQRYNEQRRVEDDRDRQAQQVKESQRRIDQLNDRMEALRAIERSFARPSNSAIPPPTAPTTRPTP
ncbi:hypothetical protein WKW79_08445 [Variovorax robiniae]|uniref:Permease n=1 Tax=Variovorax robiniae TaxID=1836199 RepID=A0ABU8X448_9BURK